MLYFNGEYFTITISIHTPHQGATIDWLSITILYRISIHTPHRGATGSLAQAIFNFLISIHTPHRGATREGRLSWTTLQISIHTPHRGATFSFDGAPLGMVNFNPHSPSGSDYDFFNPYPFNERFQSTLPIGERRPLLQIMNLLF